MPISGTARFTPAQTMRLAQEVGVMLRRLTCDVMEADVNDPAGQRAVRCGAPCELGEGLCPEHADFT